MEDDWQEYVPFPVSEETFESFALSLANVLTAPEDIIPNNDRRKINAVRLLQDLIHFPINNLPSSNSYMKELITAQLWDGLKPTSTVSDNELVELSYFVIRGSFSTELKNDVIAFIVKRLLANPSKDGCSALSHIWQSRDTIPLSSNILEELLVGEPLCIETTLLHLVQKVTESPVEDTLKSILDADNLKSFVCVCSVSPKVFQMAVTILHELLLISNANEVLLSLVKMFVRCIDDCCEGNFLDLFPIEKQPLVVFLQMDPMLYPEKHEDEEFTRNNVVKLIVDGLMHERRATSALLTYYPTWLPIVQEYCEYYKVLDLLPSHEKHRSSLKEYWSYILLEK